MKRCPTCGHNYSDETLNYCLADGSLLTVPHDPRATLRMPSPQPTMAAPTDMLHPLPPRSEEARQISNRWPVIVLIVLLAVILGVGIIVLLKLGQKNSSTVSQTSTNLNQPDVSGSNVGKENPSTSEKTSPSQQLVGVWRANVSEFGKKSEITVTWNADGSLKVLFKDAQGDGSDYGTWQYSNGIIYETYSNGSSGKGSIAWIDSDTLELTIIDNGVPAYSGLKRLYRRIK